MIQAHNDERPDDALDRMFLGETKFAVPEAAFRDQLVGPDDLHDLKRLARFGLRTAGARHDLGNLLQAIASAVRLIQRRPDHATRDELHRLTDAALKAVDRAGALNRQVHELAGIEAANNATTDLGATLLGIKGLISLAAGSGISTELRLNPDVPAVTCNVHELENVILNLVVNARDAMPLGGRLVLATFQVCGRAAAEGGESSTCVQAVLQVTDTGCGMSTNDANQAFRPFFTTKGAKRGTGLGLALVRDFAQRAGGTAEIQSAPGHGTSVFLRLPAGGL